MDRDSTETIGPLVRARTTSLQRSESCLARRGLHDLRCLMSDPEVLGYVTAIRESKSWQSRIEAWQKLRNLGPDRNGWAISLQQLLYDSDGWARIFAAESLSMHNCLPEETLPVLAATLASSLELGSLDWATVASGAIWKYRDKASQFPPSIINTLIAALEIQQTDMQGYCAATLGYCGTRARSALLPLAKICRNTEHQKLKQTALYALKQIDPTLDDCLDGFVAALQDENPSVRGEAVCEIAKFGRDAASKVSHILRLATDPHFDVRRFVAFSLGKIGSVSEEVTSTLEALCSDPQSSVCLAACYALLKLGSGMETHHGYICKSLRHSDEFVRFLAAWVLGEVGLFDSALSLQVLQMAKRSEPSQKVRAEIGVALEKLGQDK